MTPKAKYGYHPILRRATAMPLVGEPTKSTLNGRTQLYFVYGVRRANGLLDLNVGMVETRP